MSGLQNENRPNRGKRKHVVCPCGGPLHRVAFMLRHSSIRIWDRWYCPECGVMYRLKPESSVQVAYVEGEPVKVER